MKASIAPISDQATEENALPSATASEDSLPTKAAAPLAGLFNFVQHLLVNPQLATNTIAQPTLVSAEERASQKAFLMLETAFNNWLQAKDVFSANAIQREKKAYTAELMKAELENTVRNQDFKAINWNLKVIGVEIVGGVAQVEGIAKDNPNHLWKMTFVFQDLDNRYRDALGDLKNGEKVALSGTTLGDLRYWASSRCRVYFKLDGISKQTNR